MIGHSIKNGVNYEGISIAYRSKTVAARNRLVKAVKDLDDITHFFWLDDDHTFKPNLLCNLLSRNKDYIAPLMFQKTAPHYPTIYQMSENVEYGYHCFIKWPRAIFEIGGSGFGAVLMRKSVMDKVKEPYFEEKTGAYGQDLHFCSKLRKLGVRLFCDGTQDIKHIGYLAPELGIENFLQYQGAELEKVKKTGQPVIKERLQGVIA